MKTITRNKERWEEEKRKKLKKMEIKEKWKIENEKLRSTK